MSEGDGGIESTGNKIADIEDSICYILEEIKVLRGAITAIAENLDSMPPVWPPTESTDSLA